jgi:diguanylate cyclase (GGDEF)-like protein
MEPDRVVTGREGRNDLMDRWDRRLHLVGRSASAGPVARPDGGPAIVPAVEVERELDGVEGVLSAVVDAHDRALRSLTSDPTRAIHPDEAPIVQALLALAGKRPSLRAQVPLLTRVGDQWEHVEFEVVQELMGPVLRPIGASPGGSRRAAGAAHQLDRGEVLDHLATALDRAIDHQVAVLLVDLDRFKLHNDMLGTTSGDDLLREMGERVRTAAGRAFGGSLGGDEWVVVLDHLTEPARAKAVGERIRQAIAEPIDIGGESVTVTATVGVAVGGSDVGAGALLRDADTALFAGKDRGRDRVQVFGRQLRARASRQIGAAQRLRQALSTGTLELHYQPVVSLDTEAVVAAEALLRIGGPDDEPVSPSGLLDAAEDSGLIARLGRYVLEATATQIARWEPSLGRRRPFRVMVNVSPVQLGDRDFSNAISHALDSAHVSAERLSLELTEGVLLGASPTVDLVVQDLVALGIAFGLDDFGADGSSFGGLRRFPIEFLKIDRDLIAVIDRDPKAEAIVASTIAMARRLDVSTVAVGVETEAQRDLLRRLGCDAAQGFLFSPPLEPGAFTALL